MDSSRSHAILQVTRIRVCCCNTHVHTHTHTHTRVRARSHGILQVLHHHACMQSSHGYMCAAIANVLMYIFILAGQLAVTQGGWRRPGQNVLHRLASVFAHI